MTSPKICAECWHRAGRHRSGWGCEVLGCDCIEQPPFPTTTTSHHPRNDEATESEGNR